VRNSTRNHGDDQTGYTPSKLRRGLYRLLVGAPVLAAILTAATPAAPAQAATPATAPSTAPKWMIGRSAIDLINKDLGTDTLTIHAFDSSSTDEMGTAQKGAVTQPTATYYAYGPATSASSFLYAVQHKAVPAGTTYVVYDNESWSMTPSDEQANPGMYMAEFVAAAHRYGYKAILAPSVDLEKDMPCYKRSDSAWNNYLTDCDLPRLAAEAHPDVYEIQAQRYEDDTTADTDCGCYRWFVDQAAKTAASIVPGLDIRAGLASNQDGTVSTAQALYTDTVNTRGAVDGYWLNVPVQSSACPKCSVSGDPQVAAGYLEMLGYSS
jgi:hypothetical protein